MMRLNYAGVVQNSLESDHCTGPLKSHELQYLQHVKNISLCHIESVKDRSERYIDYLNVIDYEFDTMVDNIANGLKDHVETKRKDLLRRGETPVIADPDMKDPVYHVSIGTENLRVSYVERNGSASTETFSIRQYVDTRRLTAYGLFDFITEKFKNCMDAYPNENKGPGVKARVVISTSFPMMKNSIAYLKSDWMENVNECDPIVKSDLAELFNFQCKRKGLDAYCDMVTTDAVVALAYGEIAEFSPKPLMSISLGAGLDMAFLDIQYTSSDVILPLELDPLCVMMFRSVVDQLHDFNHGSTRGKRRLERMIGGDALADCTRLCMLKIFQGESLKEMFHPRVFATSDIYNIVNDLTDSHIVARKVLKSVCEESSNLEINDFVVDTLYNVCRAVVNRVIAVLAAVIIGISKGSGRCQEGFGTAQVILHGNVFKANPGVIQQLQQVVHEKIGNTVRVKYYREAERQGSVIVRRQ